jgi:type VI secretion system lysozyme-like protein
MLTLLDQLSDEFFLKDPALQLSLSIQAHLHRLFNTRKGSLAHLPDYGIPDLTGVFDEMPRSLHIFMNEIKRAILRYEPRLEAITLIENRGENRYHAVLEILITAVIKNNAFHYQAFFMGEGSEVKVA